MKNYRLYLYIFKTHLTPFFGSIIIISLLFLSNFILKSLDRLLGKDLGLSIIVEFIFLNMAWILAMAIPMAVLISTLMVYGSLGEDNEITALRASGISFSSILKPSMLFGIMVMLGLLAFNNFVLPDSNHKARLLRGDIYRKHPDLNIEPGYFIYDIPDYTLFVTSKEGDILKDIIIFHNPEPQAKVTILAHSGELSVLGNKIVLKLFDGQIHEIPKSDEAEYRILDFEIHQIIIPVENMLLERRENARKGDREMDIPEMIKESNRYKKKQQDLFKQNISLLARVNFDTTSQDFSAHLKAVLAKIDSLKNSQTKLSKEDSKYLKKLNTTQMRIGQNGKIFLSYQKQINKYWVEIHKKIAMPVACLIFVMIGSPLGMIARKGGMAIAGGLSLFFFIIYWALMMGGEQLSDRNLLSPWASMWTPNIIFGFASFFLIWYAIHERISFKLPKFISRRFENGEDETR